ncbi:hypothetical protein JOQ06_002422, partial [Pogonophryne albipinna]
MVIVEEGGVPHVVSLHSEKLCSVDMPPALNKPVAAPRVEPEPQRAVDRRLPLLWPLVTTSGPLAPDVLPQCAPVHPLRPLKEPRGQSSSSEGRCTPRQSVFSLSLHPIFGRGPAP